MLNAHINESKHQQQQYDSLNVMQSVQSKHKKLNTSKSSQGVIHKASQVMTFQNNTAALSPEDTATSAQMHHMNPLSVQHSSMILPMMSQTPSNNATLIHHN